MPFAAALSVHPDPAVAVGEATGQVLDVLEVGGADLALLFVTGHHTAALGDAAGVVRALLRPSTLLGVTAASVLGNGREVEGRPGVALWAGRFGAVHPVRIDEAGAVSAPPFDPQLLLLLADPFTTAADAVLASVGVRWPDLPVVGGMASAGRGRGGNRLLLDEDIRAGGAVGVFLGPGLEVETIVSHGARPIGAPYAVTAADGNIVRQLAGKPPMIRLADLASDELGAEELDILQRGGLHVGRVVDEHRLDFGRDDLLVREVLGANSTDGWISVAEDVEVGQTMQFLLRDADTADDDLRAVLTGRIADAALVFTDVDRGVRMFDVGDHDAGLVDEYLDRPPAAGMFCAGEFGPVGGRNFVHGSTASVALLREREGRG